jgi:hypothetical protein
MAVKSGSAVQKSGFPLWIMQFVRSSRQLSPWLSKTFWMIIICKFFALVQLVLYGKKAGWRVKERITAFHEKR